MESLQNKTLVPVDEIERELRRLTDLFTRVADLIGEYTAAPDVKLTKIYMEAKGAEIHDLVKVFNEIDREVMRQLAIMNLKGAISSSEMMVLQGVDEKVDRLYSLVNEMRNLALPDMAAVPEGALDLPRSYVE